MEKINTILAARTDVQKEWSAHHDEFDRPMNAPPKEMGANDLILGMSDKDIAWLWEVENAEPTPKS